MRTLAPSMIVGAGRHQWQCMLSGLAPPPLRGIWARPANQCGASRHMLGTCLLKPARIPATGRAALKTRALLQAQNPAFPPQCGAPSLPHLDDHFHNSRTLPGSHIRLPLLPTHQSTVRASDVAAPPIASADQPSRKGCPAGRACSPRSRTWQCCRRLGGEPAAAAGARQRQRQRGGHQRKAELLRAAQRAAHAAAAPARRRVRKSL